MSPLAKARYAEVKDWLKIVSPVASVVGGIFWVGGLYHDFREHTQAWDAYGPIITENKRSADRKFSEVYKTQENMNIDIYNNILKAANGEQVPFTPLRSE